MPSGWHRPNQADFRPSSPNRAWADCIPIDPNYLSHHVRSTTGQAFRFVELAQGINAGMPAYVVRFAQDLLNEHGKAVRGSRVGLLGVTCKAHIDDQRESPAVPVARGLLGLGADPSSLNRFGTGGMWTAKQYRGRIRPSGNRRISNSSYCCRPESRSRSRAVSTWYPSWMPGERRPGWLWRGCEQWTRGHHDLLQPPRHDRSMP